MSRGKNLRVAKPGSSSEQGLRAVARDGGGDDLRGDEPHHAAQAGERSGVKNSASPIRRLQHSLLELRHGEVRLSPAPRYASGKALVVRCVPARNDRGVPENTDLSRKGRMIRLPYCTCSRLMCRYETEERSRGVGSCFSEGRCRFAVPTRAAPRRNGEAACRSSLAPGPRIVTPHAGLGSKRRSPSP